MIDQNNPCIILTDYGVGNVIDGKIYINRLFKRYPDIYDRILDHELRHIRKEKHIDWKLAWDFELLKVVIRNPSTWVQYSPVWYDGRKKKIYIEWTLTILYLVIMGIVSLTIYFCTMIKDLVIA